MKIKPNIALFERRQFKNGALAAPKHLTYQSFLDSNIKIPQEYPWFLSCITHIILLKHTYV